jgi:hypothetical protein
MFDLFDLGLRNGTLEQLRKVEAKLDLILEHLGIRYVDPADPNGLSDEARALADQRRKIDAIKLHRAETGASLADAKSAVEGHTRRAVRPDAGS